MKQHLWSMLRAKPAAFAANANAPKHKSSRKAYAGDYAYGDMKNSKSKKMKY